MTFLIAGHPRGGTLWMAGVMRRLGYQVGHEHAIRHYYHPDQLLDGEASWTVALWEDMYPPDWPILHIIRNPLDVTRSSYQLGAPNKQLAEIGDGERTAHCPTVHTTDDPLLRAIRFYLCWWEKNLELEHNHPYMSTQIEHLDEKQLGIIARFLTGDTHPVYALTWALSLRKDYNSSTERHMERYPNGPWPAPIPRSVFAKKIEPYPEGIDLLRLTRTLGYPTGP